MLSEGYDVVSVIPGSGVDPASFQTAAEAANRVHIRHIHCFIDDTCDISLL